MTARWVVVAEVIDPVKLADFYHAYGDHDVAAQTLDEGCDSWPVASFDWPDEAHDHAGNLAAMPGLIYRVEEREVAL